MSAAIGSRPPAGSSVSGHDGMTLIEASAGTGKTHELTTIVARLLVEQDLGLGEILVVTFTRAATAELRDRIRRTLRSVHRVVGGDESAGADPQAEALLAGWREKASFDRETAARRLEAALLEIDRANVFTIHGFCQRVLSDLAFDGGFPFGFEVSGDDAELVATAARDSWRRRVYRVSRTLAGYAMEREFRPDELTQWVRAWRGKPDLRIVGGDALPAPIEAYEGRWRGALDEVRAEWKLHGEAFLAEVRDGEWLNRSRYRLPRITSELVFLETLLAHPEPDLPKEGTFGRYGTKALAAACKKRYELPSNLLFDAFDRLEAASAELRAAFDAWLRRARHEVLEEARESIRHRVRRDRRPGYEDLLLEVHDALQGEGGERLAERIRGKFPCALIDEFQDTDPVQARIFMLIYGGGEAGGAAGGWIAREARESGAEDAVRADGPRREAAAGGREAPPRADRVAGSGALRVVGDPKQSIYGFRGADVFAYLRAREAASEARALTRNWRSVPALVEAVNAMFDRPNPFAVHEIEYRPIEPARERRDPLRVEDDDGPLRFRLLPAPADEKPWPKEKAAPLAAADAADGIARLLARAAEGEATIEERTTAGEGGLRPVTGADIAVLVRTREQGRRVADALRARNVRSIEIGEASVFASREAEQMERLLWSLVDPGRDARVRGALAGDLFGLDAAALFALEEDEEDWSGWLERLRAWRTEWEADGIGRLLRRLVEAEGVAARLLRYPDGARRLTNIRHLADLLHQAEAESRLAPSALAAWFSRRRADERTRDEEAELRLESDEQLVRIMTIHVSKGLEFPIVFCPFAWDGRGPARNRSAHAAYHAPGAEGYRAVLDLAPGEEARAAAWREELSESLRLLYVALTRAKYRCVVTWGQVNQAGHTPLAWLLHNADRDGMDAAADPDAVDAAIAATAARFQDLGHAALHEEVRAFAGPHAGRISVSVIAPGETVRPPVVDESPPALAARRLGRPLRRVRQMTSYSALSAAAEPATVLPAPNPPGAESPDHDQHEAPEPPEPAEEPATGTGGRTAFTFPRGAAAGSCLHQIFERLDTRPPRAGAEADLEAICRDALRDFGFDDEWADVARAIVEATRAVRLAEPGWRAPDAGAASGESRPPDGSDGFRLVDPLPRLVELEFALPVAGLDRGRLASLLLEHGYPNPFPASSERPEDEPAPPIDGFLRGFIDLVVEHRGRWYIVDYKSNWLGPSPEDYGPDCVAAAMRSRSYPLQYLLYLVALHRYLGLRLPGYDYERHIGGVFYLFVRAMDPAAGMGRGVYFDRPDSSCMDALDTLFREGGP